MLNCLSAFAKPVIHLGSRENSISLFRDSLELKVLLLVHELCIERGFEGKRQPTNTLITSILCGPILLRVFVLVWKYLYLGNKTKLFLFLPKLWCLSTVH